MADLGYLNMFAHDIQKLASFYADLSQLEEIRESRSPIFRGLRTGKANLGFNGLPSLSRRARFFERRRSRLTTAGISRFSSIRKATRSGSILAPYSTRPLGRRPIKAEECSGARQQSCCRAAALTIGR